MLQNKLPNFLKNLGKVHEIRQAYKKSQSEL